MAFFSIGCAAFVLSAAVTVAVRWLACRMGVVDIPHGDRKIHAHPIPLLGGLAPFIAFSGVTLLLLLLQVQPSVVGTHVSSQTIIGILLGGCILMVGGALDDRYNLKPISQVIAPIVAVYAVVASGIAVRELTNPFTGGVISLGFFAIPVTTLWLLATIYTTKFLDGLDGLVSGMTVIGAVIIGLLSILFFVNVPTALLAFIVAGAFAGFLVFNFHPASIFLGEAGSTFAGYILGVLSILSGAKFATALLILAIPLLDAAWVIGRRIIVEKRSPFRADRKHIHFRLLDAGLSHRQAVLLLYTVAGVFGLAALFLQTHGKLLALTLAGIFMLFLALVLVRRERTGVLTKRG